MNGIFRKTLKRFIYDFRGLAKHEEAAKVNKAVAELANNVNLGVGEGDLEELLEVVPEELTNEVLLQLEQEHTAEEEAGEEKEGPRPQENS